MEEPPPPPSEAPQRRARNLLGVLLSLRRAGQPGLAVLVSIILEGGVYSTATQANAISWLITALGELEQSGDILEVQASEAGVAQGAEEGGVTQEEALQEDMTRGAAEGGLSSRAGALDPASSAWLGQGGGSEAPRLTTYGSQGVQMRAQKEERR